jgi:RNA polymerase sigma-70 factor (ECF subfamily)
MSSARAGAPRLTQDKILINRALQREKGGATRLVAKYQTLVRSVLNRCVKDEDKAKDLAQETFFQAFRHLGRLRDVTQFKAWLMRIAQRAFLAYRRSPLTQAQGKTVSSEDVPLELSFDRSDEDPLERCILAQEVRSVVDQIPDPFRTTLVQRYFDDLPLTEVARQQKIGLPLAKYRVRHGLKLLRERLQAAGMTERDL